MLKSIFQWPFACTERILIALLSFQILIGIVVIVVAETIKLMLLRNLPIPDGMFYTPLHVFYVQLYGVHLIFHNVIGLIFVRRCCRASKQGLAVALRMWHLFVVLVILDGILVYCFYLMTESDMRIWMKKAMTEGMDTYFDEPLMRFHWDQYQIDQQCCGIRGYVDWLKSDWEELDDRLVCISFVKIKCF